MININEIRKCVLDGDYEISYHAEIERGIDKITNSQIEDVLLNGEIIENYPEDKRGRSCLVLGWINLDAPVHIVCGSSHSGILRIITIYIPDPDRWEDGYKKRRKIGT